MGKNVVDFFVPPSTSEDFSLGSDQVRFSGLVFFQGISQNTEFGLPPIDFGPIESYVFTVLPVST